MKTTKITVNIPVNTYSVPTEIRQEAVQLICNAFLYGRSDRFFHPYNDGCYRKATRCAYRRPANNKGDFFYGFDDKDYCEERGGEFYEIRGCEMKAAFEALRKAGYHIFRSNEYGSWMGYVCDAKPFLERGYEVTEFTDFID